jgi:hypothetical protein
VQNGGGTIISSHDFDVPPFGHVQRRLPTEVVGGSLVFYLVDGPADARIFGYASVVDQTTGDPSYQAALASVVGVSQPKTGDGALVRPVHPELRPKE